MRALLVSLSVLIGSAGWWSLQAQELPQRSDATLVVATPGYEFHVDFWANLHDYLYWRAQDSGPAAEGEACIASQPEMDRSAWRAAEAYYGKELKDRHWRRDPTMRAVRYTLSGVAPRPDSMVTPVFNRLRNAAPVYRSCFWDKHRTSARERIADLVPLLVARGGPAAQRRLSEYYHAPWPADIHVDVVPYGSFAGANTATGRDEPPHMQISSIDPDLAGLSGLELLLHETSHEIFGPGRGLVGETIYMVCDSLGVDPPRDLWHALSFFTSGYVMVEVAEKLGMEYTPYGFRGLFDRAWPEYLEPIQEHWTPYLRGEVGAEEALRDVVSAVIR